MILSEAQKITKINDLDTTYLLNLTDEESSDMHHLLVLEFHREEQYNADAAEFGQTMQSIAQEYVGNIAAVHQRQIDHIMAQAKMNLLLKAPEGHMVQENGVAAVEIFVRARFTDSSLSKQIIEAIQ
jgi:hypothetical protein